MQILITVKTYPVISKKYGELVCTAGITKNGELIRRYLISFRNLSKHCRYKKYQWIEIDIEKDTSDPRKESHKITSNIAPLEIIDTRKNWFLRKKLILNDVYFDKLKLIYDLKNNDTSLAIFKPAQIIGFEIENVSNYNFVGKTYTLPFKFYYKFTDVNAKTSRLQIIDWEIGELTRKLLRQHKNHNVVKEILTKKYFTEMKKRDIYLFLGTNKQWHIRKSPNPFMIIGVFYPPFEL